MCKELACVYSCVTSAFFCSRSLYFRQRFLTAQTDTHIRTSGFLRDGFGGGCYARLAMLVMRRAPILEAFVVAVAWIIDQEDARSLRGGELRLLPTTTRTQRPRGSTSHISRRWPDVYAMHCWEFVSHNNAPASTSPTHVLHGVALPFVTNNSVDKLRGAARSKAFGLAISRSRVQILLEGTLRNNLRQVVYTYVPLSPSSITWYRPKGGDALRLGR